jgi:hypothetical protein
LSYGFTCCCCAFEFLPEHEPVRARPSGSPATPKTRKKLFSVAASYRCVLATYSLINSISLAKEARLSSLHSTHLLRLHSADTTFSAGTTWTFLRRRQRPTLLLLLRRWRQQRTTWPTLRPATLLRPQLWPILQQRQRW